MTTHVMAPAARWSLVSTVAWAIALLVSMLPDIVLRETVGNLPAWLYAAKVALIVLLLLASVSRRELRALRLFAVVLLAVFVLQWMVQRLYETLDYGTWLSGAAPFVKQVGTVQIQRATTGVLLALAMLALVGRPDRFFLVKGELNAVAAPIPWIMNKPTTWRILGPAIAGAMCLGLLGFTLVFGSLPSFSAVKSALPLLPFVLLFAASNAFGEEMIYRAPWLAALKGPVGPVQALLITAVCFGLGHFYGVPYGVLGVAMAFIPGWLMGKAMLETRGFFWAWFIHLCMDVVIFCFMALGSISPGG